MGKAPTVIVENCPPYNWQPAIKVPLREGMTLEDLIETLQLPSDTEAVIVNNVIVRPSYRLQDGDRVKVIPFMSGG
jgi:thiamine biosynthesis protein ThiS